MKIKGIAWAGTKTDKYEETTAFFKDVLKFKVLEDKDIVTVFELPNGDIFEVLSPLAAPEIGHPKGCKVDFLVEDVFKTIEELKSSGCTTTGPVFSEEIQDWSNFVGPDGNLYGFTNMCNHPLSQPGYNRILFYGPHEENAYLSNWYPAALFLKGKIWSSSEHYYQAQKVAGTSFEEICRRQESPRLAFELSRRPDFPVRADWDVIKVNVMQEAVSAKFHQNPDLLEKLLSTGELEIIENSPIDYFWGIGEDGSGKNTLGKILMDLRNLLRTKK